MRHRPHDLLWLADAARSGAAPGWPDWASPGWCARVPVVVRRAPPDAAGRLAVGLRGLARHQRCAAWAAPDRVLRSKTPEALLAGWRREGRPAHWRDRPCLRALDAVAAAWSDLGLDWGVTGSVGFALASGIELLRDDSDLDLLVRTGSAADAGLLRRLEPMLAPVAQVPGARIDVQVQTPRGGFALREWLDEGGRVLLKTDSGPLLCDDPWHPDAAPDPR
ncbi:MAG: malonate decarboxylase holo-ACP synthase [Burkholderiales bacterium]|nr:malonate decarboxylase holo-ACP synthase [Burkholderiales bacterium]